MASDPSWRPATIANVKAVVKMDDKLRKNIAAKTLAKTEKAMYDVLKGVANDMAHMELSLDDHTLYQLFLAYNPYGHTRPNPGIHSPSWAVHEQTGDLLTNIAPPSPGVHSIFKIKKSVSAGRELRMWLTLNPQHDEVFTSSGFIAKALLIHEGTSQMIPRPFLTVGGRQYLKDRSDLVSMKASWVKK